MCGLAKKEPLKPFVTILNGKKETPYPKQHTFLSAKYITPLEIVFMWLWKRYYVYHNSWRNYSRIHGVVPFFFQRNVYTVQARYWQKCRNQFSKHAMRLEIQSRQSVTVKIEGFANLCHIDHDSAFLHLQNIFSFARIRHGSRFLPTIIVAW